MHFDAIARLILVLGLDKDNIIGISRTCSIRLVDKDQSRKKLSEVRKKTNDFKINKLCARKDSLIFRLHKIPRMNIKLKYKKW